MGYTLESEEYETRVELANGAKIFFNMRGARRNPQSETPLVCVFYEGPPPERDMDYLEMSLYVLDGTPMLGDVAIEGETLPHMHFLNLSDEANATLIGPLRPAFQAFRERNRARLIELATLGEHSAAQAIAAPAPRANVSPVAAAAPAKRTRRRRVDDPVPEFKLPEGFIAATRRN